MRRIQRPRQHYIPADIVVEYGTYARMISPSSSVLEVRVVASEFLPGACSRPVKRVNPVLVFCTTSEGSSILLGNLASTSRSSY